MGALLKLLFLAGVLNFVLTDDVPVFMCPSTRTIHSGINIAHLTVSSHGVNSNVTLKLVSTECHKCELQVASFIPNDEKNCSVIVDTRWPVKMAIVSDDKNSTMMENCSGISYLFETGGIYYMYVKRKNTSYINCQGPVLLNSPSDSNIAIYVTIGIFTAVGILWVCFKKSRRHILNMFSNVSSVVDDEIVTETDLGTPTNIAIGQEGPKKERLKSLDTFRGLSLVVMMFVNYGGGGYWFFNHSKWNGLTVADLVFPWFIWIMGTALAYSFQSLSRSNISKGRIFLKILRRTLILFALGLLINSSGTKNFKKWRVMGVLQRFSLTYFIVASIQLLFLKSSNQRIISKWHAFQDITYYWKEWIIQLSLVVLHLCLTFLLHVPGCPTGYLGPGGLAQDSTQNVSLCTGGAAGYIDRVVLGDKQVYNSPTCKEIYDTTEHYDPEGLLGTLNSCFLCFLGLQAGKILTTFHNPKSRVVRFAVWSVVLGAIAAILCKASKNDGWIPVNKNLWSLSYILTMASFAFALFTFCYLIVDVYSVWTGAPFFYPGMNSIVVYVCHEVFSQPFQSFWGIDPQTHAIFMLINIWDVTFWVLMSVFLFYKKIFIAI